VTSPPDRASAAMGYLLRLMRQNGLIGPSCWRWVPGLGRVYVCY